MWLESGDREDRVGGAVGVGSLSEPGKVTPPCSYFSGLSGFPVEHGPGVGWGVQCLIGGPVASR